MLGVVGQTKTATCLRCGGEGLEKTADLPKGSRPFRARVRANID